MHRNSLWIWHCASVLFWCCFLTNILIHFLWELILNHDFWMLQIMGKFMLVFRENFQDGLTNWKILLTLKIQANKIQKLNYRCNTTMKLKFYQLNERSCFDRSQSSCFSYSLWLCYLEFIFLSILSLLFLGTHWASVTHCGIPWNPTLHTI